jgi:hypothetical protein
VSIEDLFLAGLGFDIAGAYLVSRGLLQGMPKLASTGGTMWALEKSRVPHAVEDRIRGTVGLVALVLGFSLQVFGYVGVLNQSKVHYGHTAALIGVGLALGIAVAVLLLEAVIRPRWRDSMLVRIAQNDYQGAPWARRDKPRADLLHRFGMEMGEPALEDEGSIAYCMRVFGVEASTD